MAFLKGSARIRQGKIIWSVIVAVYLLIWSLPFWKNYSGTGVGTNEALALLRDPSRFSWYIIVLIMMVLYITFDEIQRGNIKAVLAGTAFFLMDFFNEIWNALYYKATGFAAVWQVGTPNTFQPLIGWNIEIMLMFFIGGLASTKLIPKDKDLLYFGWLNNRHFHAAVLSVLFVIVEIIVHKLGFIHWNYWWWQPEFPWVFIIIGYMPFYEVLFFVYDLPDVKSQVKVVGGMAGVLIPAFIILVSLGLI